MTAMDQLPVQQQQQQMPLSPPHVSFPATATAATTLPAPTDAPPAAPDVEQPVAQPHGIEWFKENGRAQLCINGQRVHREWSIKTTVGETLSLSRKPAAESISRLDMFMNMFGFDSLHTIVALTNLQLNKKGKTATTRQEILKFFGVCILATRFEFSTRFDLWSTQYRTKYSKPAGFGNTGMSRQRFDTLYSSVRFSFQPDERPEHMRSEDYGWMLVDGFVNAFNMQRVSYFEPSSEMCVDKSISVWYGQGGNSIKLGLPHHQPENGCRMQNCACAQSGIMLRLRLVKTPEAEDPNAVDDNEGMLHGTAVLKHLVQPWAHTGRFVGGNSYFASVGATQAMTDLGFGFVGVVKTATRGYPKTYLEALELSNHGDYEGVVTLQENGLPTMMAFVWMDRERRYFIANTSSLKAGTPYTRNTWQEIAPVESNEHPVRVESTIPQPEAAELFNFVVASVDRHNCCRQDNLQLERKVGTHDWLLRVNLTILGMHIVDTWLAWKGLSLCEDGELENDFYEYLAEELIDNEYDSSTVTRRRTRGDHSVPASPVAIGRDGSPSSGIGIHLTPTKKKRKKDGCLTNHLAQQHCKVCHAKTSYECSGCIELDSKPVFLCHSKTGRDCFAKHFTVQHSH